ncbi:glycosyltransferase [Paraburkholderia megapolitana]|nr:glycosyltransferase [Paraburkholderia megapolitana]QDQ83738.1 glycosyltransferase [Paraburkholderia megapolitana]
MKILLIHQNLPAQFRHLMFHCAQDPRVEIVAIGERKRIRENIRRLVDGVRFIGYDFTPTPRDRMPRDLWTTGNALRRGRAVAACMRQLAADGFRPDLVYGHPGWGDMLHVKDVFPQARVVEYCEFYFNRDGQDYQFDPEFPDIDPEGLRIRTENMPQLVSLVAADAGISPTQWQRSRYPMLFQPGIEVVHDGIDLDLVKPNPTVRMHLPQRGITLTRDDQVITYVARNLEPYRGFHCFMRALPQLQRRLPRAHVVIVGADGVSYGKPPAKGTWREHCLAEVGPQLDASRVHFLGRLPYIDYLRVLQLSSAHVYLTYPFVLSWSMLEAMAAGAVVVGSRTAPVEEVIDHGCNGLLVDFFAKDELVDALVNVCSDAALAAMLRDAGIATVRERFSLRDLCLPRQIEMLGL